jgi:hypothetical protein
MDPKEAVHVLMNDGIAFATKMLKEHGKFHPYARSLSGALAITDIAAYDGDEFPPGANLLQLLEEGLREKVISDADIAIATFTNVSLRDEHDARGNAVQIGLEHAGGYSVNVYFPYSVSEAGVSYGELITMEREPNIF